jgi:hypothetical protein
MGSVPQILPNPLAQGRADVRVWDAPRPLALWHLASLDAPTVAVVWTLGFAWAAGVRLPAWVPILIALAVWAVYIADRLLDARAAPRMGATHRLHERHRFHWLHRGILAPLAVAAACAAAILIAVFMPPGTLAKNSVLAAAALLYFTRVHTGLKPPTRMGRLLAALLSKELLVGLLFTAGCVLPAFSRAAANPGEPLWPLTTVAVCFALLAWLNCHAIDRWESREESPAAAQIFAPAGLLVFAAITLAAVLFPLHPRFCALAAAGAAGALLLALLDRLRNRLTPLAVRAAADLVLLTPLALLLR